MQIGTITPTPQVNKNHHLFASPGTYAPVSTKHAIINIIPVIRVVTESATANLNFGAIAIAEYNALIGQTKAPHSSISMSKGVNRLSISTIT